MYKYLSKFFIFLIIFLSIVGNLNAYVKVKGYYRKDGTYVKPHVRSNPNGVKYDNYGYKPSQGLYNKTYGTKGEYWDTPTYITDTDYYEGMYLYETNNSKTTTSFSDTNNHINSIGTSLNTNNILNDYTINKSKIELGIANISDNPYQSLSNFQYVLDNSIYDKEFISLAQSGLLVSYEKIIKNYLDDGYYQLGLNVGVEVYKYLETAENLTEGDVITFGYITYYLACCYLNEGDIDSSYRLFLISYNYIDEKSKEYVENIINEIETKYIN